MDSNLKDLIGREIVVGFRPEGIDIFSVNNEDKKLINYIECKVTAIEFEGHRTLIDFVDKQGKIFRYSINPKENELKEGDIFGIRWLENMEILFDKDTGKRIC